MYWKYENTLKKLESRIGYVSGATGAVYAIRRSLFNQLPNNCINDDFTISMKIIEKGYKCSLDIPLNAAEDFLESTCVESNNFIPQIRVPIPYIEQWNYNTMLKIDDKGFNKSNPGIWTHSLHDLMDRKKFTDWKDYGLDKVLK